MKAELQIFEARVKELAIELKETIGAESLHIEMDINEYRVKSAANATFTNIEQTKNNNPDGCK